MLDTTLEGRNFKNDYKFKIKLGQKATNGQIQLKELTVASDDQTNLIDIALNLLIDQYKVCKNKKLKVLSPFIDGYEPS